MNWDLALTIIQYTLKYGPTAGKALADLFKKKEVTPEELSNAFSLAELSYDEIVHPKTPTA